MRKLLILLMCALMLSGCGGNEPGDIQEPENVTIDEGSEESNESIEQSEELKESIEETEMADQESQTNQTIEPEISINELVLVEESGIKITAKRLSRDELFGAEIKLLIENDSGKDLTFQCRNASVNGYMVETMMSVDVVNGKKANDSLIFMESELAMCGITDIADMEFSFHIFDSASWDTYLDTEQIQIETSIADTYEYVYDDSGNLAYEGNGVKIIVKGLDEDSSIFGPSIVVYIENNSEKNITVQTRDVSINGFMMDAMFSSDVMNGKKAVDAITFLETEIEENEITEIESVELSFHIFELEGWDTIVDTEIVTITF